MGNPKCKTCKHYKPEPIVKNEGICTDPMKAIYIADSRDNDTPKVFDFSWCTNHQGTSTKVRGKNMEVTS